MVLVAVCEWVVDGVITLHVDVFEAAGPGEPNAALWLTMSLGGSVLVGALGIQTCCHVTHLGCDGFTGPCSLTRDETIVRKG